MAALLRKSFSHFANRNHRTPRVTEASAEQNARKIVVKYSYGCLAPDKQSDADEDLRNEYQWLKRLRGAEHIAQLIDMADCSLQLPGISNGENTYEESVQKQKDEVAAAGDGSQSIPAAPVRRCPTFALEYLTYGTVYNLKRRLFKSGQIYIPSRLLWRIWLCLVRQCVGMAFPPDIPDDQYVGQVIREVIQDRPYAFITQNSAHTNNFMLNAAELPGDEHEPNLPVVKLIDFGRGKTEDGESEPAKRRSPDNVDEYANKKNLNGAADASPFSLIISEKLCCTHGYGEEPFRLRKETVPYTWNDASGTHTIQTRAPQILRENIFIDPQLRHLLVRVMANPYSLKPSLRDVLNETEMAITRGPLDAEFLALPLGDVETDNVLEEFMQHWLYNAPES
ncbi:hypothetical protein F4801DRAFT_591686 [Xylaria longipes]|nr:hypothetical protein F4801DRAFT_591686 [Xylaria longipes]